MKNVNQIKKTIINILTISKNIYNKALLNLRILDSNIQDSQQENGQQNNSQKNQLTELFIYVGILFGLIVIILGGYAIYKYYLEKQALREILRENQNYNNFLYNSISGASEQERQVYSFNNNNIYNKYKGSEVESYNQQNNSFDYNHEERLENIRKKYGNKMLIKILIKQQIEEVIYDKNLGLEYGDNCTICVNNFIENMEIYKTPCEHFFHKDCLNKYLKKLKKKSKLTCPNCNQNLLVNKKFLKLRHENKKIKIKDNKITIKNNNLDNFRYDKKDILFDNSNISTNFKNAKKKNNKENKTILKKDNDEIFIVRKRKVDITKNVRHSATVENKYVNIYSPSKSLNMKNKQLDNNKKEEEISIYDSNNDANEGKKGNELNDKNVSETNIDIFNLNINKDKRNKNDKVKNIFSNIENEDSKNQNYKELNSKREFIENKMIINLQDNDESHKS
jgi:hypothetical protein